MLKETGTNTISSPLHSLEVHYKIRIMVSVWWFSGTTNTVNVWITDSTGGNLGSGTAGTITPSAVSTYAGATLDPYCTNSRASNYELYITESTQDIYVKFQSSAGSNWGIR